MNRRPFAAAGACLLLASALALSMPSIAQQDAPRPAKSAKHEPAPSTAPAPKAAPEAPRAKPDPLANADVRCTPAPATTNTDPDKGPVSFRDCLGTPEMINLRGGEFDMGETANAFKPAERPVHKVTLKPFALGRFEVTFDEWDACVHARGCTKNPDDDGWGRGTRPVINITWDDAQQYVAWLSRKSGHRYRLPSEAEWEYAARAGTTTAYSWGDQDEWMCGYANILDFQGRLQHPDWTWSATCDDGFAFTAPVGSFKPNDWGFHDMAGNVWEWTQDCWHADYTGAPEDGSAWIQGGQCDKRVNRGGGWGNHPRSMRTATRDADKTIAFGDAIGFRVARDP